MNGYAFIVGENNYKLSRRVQGALFAVGIGWPELKVQYTSAPILYVMGRKITYGGSIYNLMKYPLTVRWASWAIKNASELEGAMMPWEIPPAGYRIVTEDERSSSPPTGLRYKNMHCRAGQTWSGGNMASICWDDGGVAYAVPVEFVFETDADKKKRELIEQAIKSEEQADRCVNAARECRRLAEEL